MSYIEQVKIKGFKKFEDFTINFNPELNVIVGENECGKSTILEAINLVVNQTSRSTDKYIISEYLNKHNINEFKKDPTATNLPKIEIEVYLKLGEGIKTIDYLGKNNSDNKKATGLTFVCEFDMDYSEELVDIIKEGIIPTDYYTMTWLTFSGEVYKVLKKPISILTIDNSNIDSNNSYNYYYKMLFTSKYSKEEKMKYKHLFRTKSNSLFEELDLGQLDEGSIFGINHKKIILENILTVYDNNIPLENRGKGKENLVKTKIAIDKSNSKVDTILIEEPENHLSHTNLRKMISEIDNQTESSQLITTTHNNLIINKLNLENVLWISKNESKSLRSVDPDDASYFQRIENNNLLQFILAEKVILVEGPTEYILVPKIFEIEQGESMEESGIDVIACNGISYKRYIEIAKHLDKKVLILTDNDENKVDISCVEGCENIKIFSESDLELFTWEVCFYELNKAMLNEIVDIDADAAYAFKKVNYKEIGKPVLGKMLNNKVDIAMKMMDVVSDSDSKFCNLLNTPQYIKDGLAWIKD